MKLKVLAKCGLLIVIAFCVGMFLVVNFKSTAQDNYADYMITINDQFVKSTYMFSSMITNIERVYSDEELDFMSQLILQQDAIIRDLENNPPETKNADYGQIYDDVIQLYLFFIQGEIYCLEQFEHAVGDRNDERYNMGLVLQNTTGDVIISVPDAVNSIRGTDIKPQYETLPRDNVQEVA